MTRRFQASRDEVWAALTDPLSIGRWLAAVIDVELTAGGSFELALPDGSAIAASVREVDPATVLELAWSYAGEDGSIVRFELTDDGDDTLLVLDHRLIDERFGKAYTTRWSAALDRLSIVIAR